MSLIKIKKENNKYKLLVINKLYLLYLLFSLYGIVVSILLF